MIKFKVGKSLDQISMLVASIQTLYSGQRNYSGLTLKATSATEGIWNWAMLA